MDRIEPGPREVWLRCPHCRDLLYIELEFYAPEHDRLLLFCPRCRTSFDKYESPEVWGAPRSAPLAGPGTGDDAPAEGRSG